VLNALPADHPQRADVEEMVKAGGRAAQVTRHLLAFSRRQVLQPTVVDVNAVISDLTVVLRRLLGSDRRLDVRTAPVPLRTVADRSQLEQVLINLVANARDATRTNGVVTVEAERVQVHRSTLVSSKIEDVAPGAFVRLTIRDDGAGMTPETITRAFEPFFTTKPLGEGTGLGLSMVYGIVSQSGGYVTIESALSAGTVVRVHLPFADDEVEEVERALPTARGFGERILVVEDESMVRAIATRALEAVGYEVYQAPNGAAALDFLASRPGHVDLVLSDLVMPNVNGQQLAARIAALGLDIPMLFMSAYSAEEISRRGLGGPEVALIQKPFTLDALAAAVRERLERSRRDRGA
jgi:CheY-like chemotaxis protein